jgi:hypothetical protein
MPNNNMAENLEYTLLNMQNIQTPEEIDLLNKVYIIWLETWEKVFAEKGLRNAVNIDEFCRQNVAHVLSLEGAVIGFLFGTFYDSRLAAHLGHSYIKPLNIENMIEKLPYGRMQSMEYLTVDKNFRGTRTDGMPYSEVLIALSLRSLSELGCSYALATPRTDIRVHQMTHRVGMWQLQDPVLKYKYECAVFAARRNDDHVIENEKVASMVQWLWKNRKEKPRPVTEINFKVAA